MRFKSYRQLNTMDCGPTSLKMVAKYYGKNYDSSTLARTAGFNREGVSFLGLSDAAENIGLRSRGVQVSVSQLLSDVPLPCILHWNKSHFVVLPPQRKKRSKKSSITIADPAIGIINLSWSEFMSHWKIGESQNGEPIGLALLLEPSPDFYSKPSDDENKSGWGFLFQYLRGTYWQAVKVIVGLLVSTLLQLVFPFLTQSIVDIGINTKNLQFVTIVLVAQLMLVFSRNIVDFIRSRILLRISVFLNLSILSDFWIKLGKLPISYFDSHNAGNILQKMGDNRRIETFLTGSALGTLFSLLSFILYAIILALYNIQIFVIFILGAILYYAWVKIFMKFRRKLNYQTFHLSSEENNATLEFVQGMQDIKLNNAEQIKRWEWENIQANIFKLNFRTLTYNQFQQSGALFINQGKDVIITFLVARLVIGGQLTLGAMLAIQYILAQLNGPIEQFVGFAQSAQDAKISLERVKEVHNLEDEEDKRYDYSDTVLENRDIIFNNVSFKYPGAGMEYILRNICLAIPVGKTTAIVGPSGSGKTTFLKLILKFFRDYEGDIKVGESNLQFVSSSYWRKQCGAVLQDGYIFDDTIAKNIAVGFESYELSNLIAASRMANILDYIQTLPNGFQTKLGSEGVGLSQGQKQRILIARAIYRNPNYLFFDEATNALDANNERYIVRNLSNFFKGKTVVIAAHRLSTVRNADNYNTPRI